MAEGEKQSFQIPMTWIMGGVFALLVGGAYVFFGPDAAKSVCSVLIH